MFVNSYVHQIDDKGRIRLPKKFRLELAANPLIMKGVENKCLYVYSNSFAEQMFEREFANGSYSESEKNIAKAKLMGKAFFADEDKQGRYTIPASLLKFAGISCSSTIISIGSYDHVQIWDKANWEKEIGESADDSVSEDNAAGSEEAKENC